jgi:hypothetical protein
MFLEAVNYTSENLLTLIKSTFKLLLSFLALTIVIDFAKLSLGQGHGSAEFIIGLIEVVATYYFYALIIKKSFSFIEGREVRALGLNFLIYLRVNIIYSLLFFLGAFLVIPGLWALVFLYFAPIITLDDNYQGGKFLKRSIQLVRRGPWPVVFLAVISVIIMALDLALFPMIKKSELWQVGIVVKNIAMIVAEYFFLLLTTKIYLVLKGL